MGEFCFFRVRTLCGFGATERRKVGVRVRVGAKVKVRLGVREKC